MLRTRPRRPSAILSQIRTLMQDDIGNVTATLRRIERGALTQLQFQEVTNDQLGRVLERLVKIERAVGICEQA
jgi:hypothetical protein